MYIGGLKYGSVRADLMTNWQTGKYATLMDLQNDAAENSLRRSSTIVTPRIGGSNSHHGKGKAHMPQPASKRLQPIGFGQNHFGSHDSFGAISSKGVSNTMKSWGHPKNAKETLKGLLSPLPSTSTSNENVATKARTTTLGTKPRND